MSAEAIVMRRETGNSECWCCGKNTNPDALVHLGNHPEVGICLNCVQFLRRRGDLQATARRRRLRSTAESVRREVMTRGWRDRPVIGRALKWLNRRLPW